LGALVGAVAYRAVFDTGAGAVPTRPIGATSVIVFFFLQARTSMDDACWLDRVGRDCDAAEGVSARTGFACAGPLLRASDWLPLASPWPVPNAVPKPPPLLPGWLFEES
jgi:hypothetical protein